MPPDAAVIEALVCSPPRLDAVAQTELLDSEQEESFDALTRLAARLLNVPVSFVSIIDSQRDFYKSQVGFPEALAAQRQMSGRTFCHLTLAGDELLVIEDTYSNPVWQAVPTVLSLGVRAYVGVPLKIGKQTIGSFCVMDIRPRRWDDNDLETLRQLALSVNRELVLRHALAVTRDAARHARSMARAREELVAVVAHDLRTPLQILQLSTALLQRDPKVGRQDVVARMGTAIGTLNEMTNSLLSSSSAILPAGPHTRPVAAAALLTDAVDMMAPIAERDGIVLAAGELAGATVLVDYAQMLRVLGNLIGNAIKYSPAGSAVTVAVQRDAAEAVFTVADNGRGMTVQEQLQAFEQGWQGNEGMARGDGAGLGLSIVKSLVEAHGGRVGLVSEPGRGSSLTFVLPCS